MRLIVRMTGCDGRVRPTFRLLRSADLPHRVRVEERDRLREAGHDKVFTGTMDRLEVTYGKIRRDGPGDFIFVHRDKVGEETWAAVTKGARVCFGIGFAFSGPTAVKLEVLS